MIKILEKTYTNIFLTKYYRNTHVILYNFISATGHMAYLALISSFLYYPFCISSTLSKHYSRS